MSEKIIVWVMKVLAFLLIGGLAAVYFWFFVHMLTVPHPHA